MQRVSVIIPAYNTAPFISESLDSALGQRFNDLEVIVINDGSPDTPELERVLRTYGTHIQYIKQENRGLSAARNAGLRCAHGELVAFLDSDDVWLPDYLATQVNFLDEHPGIFASITDAVLFGTQRSEEVWKMVKSEGPSVLTFDQLLKRQGGQLPSAMVAKRSRVLKAGMFDETLRIGEDVEFFVRLCFPDGAIGYPGKALVKYRQRPGSLTSDPRNRKWNVAEIAALTRLGETLALNAEQRAVLSREIAACQAALALSDARDYLGNKEFQQAARCLRRANAYYRDPRIGLALAGLRLFPRWTARILRRHWAKNQPLATAATT